MEEELSFFPSVNVFPIPQQLIMLWSVLFDRLLRSIFPPLSHTLHMFGAFRAFLAN